MRRTPSTARYSATRADESTLLDADRPEVSVSHVGSSRASAASQKSNSTPLTRMASPPLPRVPSSQGSSFGEPGTVDSEDTLIGGNGRMSVAAQPAALAASYEYNNAKPSAGATLARSPASRKWLVLMIGVVLFFCVGSFVYWNAGEGGMSYASKAARAAARMSPSSLRGSHSRFHWSKVLSSREGRGRGGGGAQTFDFVLVTDLDHASKVSGNGVGKNGKKQKETWRAYLQLGTISFAPSAWTKLDQGGGGGGGGVSISWGERVEMQTHHGEAGRGFELSELQMYRGSLYSFDDRSGIVFDIRGDYKAVPVHILMEGDGETDKGFKTEWATVKVGKGVVWCACVDLTLLCFALLYFAWLDFALLCFALLCFALLYFALLCCAVLCCALRCPGPALCVSALHRIASSSFHPQHLGK